MQLFLSDLFMLRWQDYEDETSLRNIKTTHQTKRCHVPEERDRRLLKCENLKPRQILLILSTGISKCLQ
jgi:hypothetical protein